MILKAHEIPSRQTRPGVIGKEPKLGTKVVFSEWSFAAGIEVLPHKHNNESYGYILKGELVIRLDGGDEQILTQGDLFFLKPNTERYLKILQDTIIVYASSPTETT
jgi:quercetin dioxygenase-like cupin family protein